MLRAAITDYFSAWTNGFQSGQGESIKYFLADDFRGFWSQKGMLEPSTYGKDYEIEGALNGLSGATASFEELSLMERGEHEAVLCCIKTVLHNGHSYKSTIMYIWRLENEEWKIIREYVEVA